MQDSLKKSLVLFFFGTLFIYSLTAAGTIFGLDGSIRYEVTKNLMTQGRLDVTVPCDCATGRDGLKYPKWTLGHSIAMAPFFILGKTVSQFKPSQSLQIEEFFTSFTNIFLTAFAGLLLIILGLELQFSPKIAWFAGFLFSFATMAWQQSKDSSEHPLVMVFYLILFIYLHRYEIRKDTKSLILGGVAGAAALWSRYPAMLLMPAAVFWIFLASPPKLEKKIRALFFFCIPVGLGYVGNMAVNAYRLGSPYLTGQRYLWHPDLSPAIWLEGVWKLTLDPFHGFFIFNPIFFLAIPGLLMAVKEKRLAFLSAALAFATYLFFFAATATDIRNAGWSWGPRQFADLLPLMILAMMPALRFIEGKKGKAPLIWILLLGISVSIQISSVLVNSNRTYWKQSRGVSGLDFEEKNLKNTQIIQQFVNIADITKNTFAQSANDSRVSDINANPSLGQFQLWWVYALKQSIPGAVVLPIILGLFLVGLIYLFRSYSLIKGIPAPL